MSFRAFFCLPSLIRSLPLPGSTSWTTGSPTAASREAVDSFVKLAACSNSRLRSSHRARRGCRAPLALSGRPMVASGWVCRSRRRASCGPFQSQGRPEGNPRQPLRRHNAACSGFASNKGRCRKLKRPPLTAPRSSSQGLEAPFTGKDCSPVWTGIIPILNL